MSTLIGAETGFKTIAAVHSQCPLRVISGQTIAGQNPPLSIVSPIGDKLGRGRFVRYVLLATDTPQQTAFLFDHLVGNGEQRRRHVKAERLRSFEIDHKFVPGRRLGRKFGRVRSLQNTIHVVS